MKTVTLALSLLWAAPALAGDSPQFRGPQRNGVFPERGLLKSWPAGGPPKMWSAAGLGKGFSSVAVAGDRLYVTGMFDDEGYLFAFDLDGKRLYKVSYGPEFPNGYPGARTTPTIDDGMAFVISSRGKLVGFKAADGAKLWEADTLDLFKGSRRARSLIPTWGIAESVLVDGDRVICTPGGKEAGLAAFDKKTGALVWTAKGLSDKSGYCSARVFDNGRVRQIVTMTGKSMVGVDPASGQVVWKQSYPGRYNIHAVSPVFFQNYIYVSDGYGQGGAMFELAADGRGVTRRWRDRNLDCHHGGVVQVGGYVYGASSKGKWMCLDIRTGKLMAAIPGVGKGSTVYADGMIYGYGERGDVGLFKADPADFRLVSRFKVEEGRGRHWAHPTISRGVLYIRHGDVMIAYRIKAD